MIDILLVVIAILILCVTGNILSFIGVRESLELANKRLGMVLDERAKPEQSKPHPVTGRPISESHEEHKPLRRKSTGWQAAKNALEQASREPELKREETIRKNEEVLRG